MEQERIYFDSFEEIDLVLLCGYSNMMSLTPGDVWRDFKGTHIRAIKITSSNSASYMNEILSSMKDILQPEHITPESEKKVLINLNVPSPYDYSKIDLEKLKELCSYLPPSLILGVKEIDGNEYSLIFAYETKKEGGMYSMSYEELDEHLDLLEIKTFGCIIPTPQLIKFSISDESLE